MIKNEATPIVFLVSYVAEIGSTYLIYVAIYGCFERGSIFSSEIGKGLNLMVD